MSETESSRHEIRIDLQGLIRLLAKNLYAEPDVFVRELVQNAHDSLQRRAEIDGGAVPPGRIHILTDYRAGTITFDDNGAGLTETEIHEYLATIGRSGTGAFRQELARRGRQAEVSLIGQFGIGLLSAFVVAHRVEVETLSARPGNRSWVWISEGQHDYELRAGRRMEAGTTVTLHITDNFRDMLDPEELRKVIKKYADFIPFPIVLNSEDEPTNVVDAPWHREFGDEQERLGEYWVFVNRRFPDVPLEVLPIDLQSPHSVSGVLYISDRAVPDINTAGLLDVYQSRMFLMSNNRDLLPAWAKFVRGVVDSPSFTPTASRDAIQFDATAREIREQLGGLIVRHLRDLAGRDPGRFSRIMEWHAYHMTGMAVAHNDFFDAVADLVPFETNRGRMNLRDYAARAPRVDERPGIDLFYFSEMGSATQFYLLCDAKGLLVINAIYNFDEQFLRKYAKRRPQVRLHHITVAGSAFLFEALSRTDAAEFGQLALDFQALLPDSRSQARVVRFSPADLPAVTVLAADSKLRDDLDRARRSAALPASVRDLAGRLFTERETVPVILHLNANNLTIQQLAALAAVPASDHRAYEAAVAAIYNNALLLAQHQLTPESAQSIVASFNRVIELLMEQTRCQSEITVSPPPGSPHTSPQRPASATVKSIVCATLLPAEDSVVRQAVISILEQAPFYWRVVRYVPPGAGPIDPAEAELIAAAQVVIADISDRDPQALMGLGYLRWSLPVGSRLLIVLEREGTRLAGVDLDNVIRLSYPASADTGAVERVAAKIRTQLDGLAAIARLQATPRAHALSAGVLYGQFDVEAPLAAPLAVAYPTMEALQAAPVDEMLRRVPGLSRSLARGLQAEIADTLGQMRQ